MEDEDLLLAVLNSAPIVDGRPTDELATTSGSTLLASYGATGSAVELAHVSQVRDRLQAVIRGEDGALTRLETTLGRVRLSPRVMTGGIDWSIDAPDSQRLGARVVLAWSRVLEEAPGRLRPCANEECNLFLIDHSRPGTAKWCSMSTCGNKMKARSFAERRRSTDS